MKKQSQFIILLDYYIVSMYYVRKFNAKYGN